MTVRSSILAITLVLAVGLPALAVALPTQAHAQKRDAVAEGRYRTKTTFYYNLCVARGGTHWRCGVRLHYWTNRHPNGRVVY